MERGGKKKKAEGGKTEYYLTANLIQILKGYPRLSNSGYKVHEIFLYLVIWKAGDRKQTNKQQITQKL